MWLYFLARSYKHLVSSPVGGSSSGQWIVGVVQEIDIASGNVIFEWHGLDHVGIAESYLPLPTSSGAPWDYIHLKRSQYRRRRQPASISPAHVRRLQD
jgi:hypothetical protein